MSQITEPHKEEDLVEVQHLVKYFPVHAGLMQRVVNWVKAVDDVSFTVMKGETLGMVGESGCGKTTIGRSMLRLVEPTSGSVHYDNKDVLKLSGKKDGAAEDSETLYRSAYHGGRVDLDCQQVEGILGGGNTFTKALRDAYPRESQIAVTLTPRSSAD